MSQSCDPMDCRLLGSSVHGILQARKLKWVAISFSNLSFPSPTYIILEGLFSYVRQDRIVVSALKLEVRLSNLTLSLWGVCIGNNNVLLGFTFLQINQNSQAIDPCGPGIKKHSWSLCIFLIIC